MYAFGPGWVYAIDAGTFAVSASFLVRLPAGTAAPAARKKFMADLADGWREVTSRSWVWASILYFAVWNFAIAAFFVLGPVVSDRELGGARDWGLILSGGAIGSVVGSLLALRIRPRRPLFTGYLLISVAALPTILLVRPFPVLVIAAAAVVAMVTLAFAVTLWQTALQERIPREALSRVFSYDWVGSLVLMPLGFAVAGPLAMAIGIDATLWLAAGLLFASSIAVALVPGVRRITRRDDDESSPLREVEVERVQEIYSGV